MSSSERLHGCYKKVRYGIERPILQEFAAVTGQAAGAPAAQPRGAPQPPAFPAGPVPDSVGSPNLRVPARSCRNSPMLAARRVQRWQDSELTGSVPPEGSFSQLVRAHLVRSAPSP